MFFSSNQILFSKTNLDTLLQVKKKCPNCLRELPESGFNWKIKNIKRAVYCKVCSREFIKQHYIKNQQYYLAKTRKRNEQLKKQSYQFIGDYLQKHPCVDCKETDILVLEFDHKDRSTKKGDISSIIRRRLSLDTLKSEIVKCEVRCANCHRRKTERENDSWKLYYAPVAQWIEHLSSEQGVGSSNLSWRTNKK